MTDELDEILNIHTIDAGNRVLKLIDVNEAKQAIQALIDRECNKARYEVASRITTDMGDAYYQNIPIWRYTEQLRTKLLSEEQP